MTTTTDLEVLGWVDVETTGLNPWKGDYLLEVAAIMSDLEGNEISGEFQRVIHYDDEGRKAAQMAALQPTPYVFTMHENTGLWGRLATGTPREQVDAELLAFFKTCAPEPKQARLAGNSIRLDMNFLEAYAPGSYGHLHYRTVDVSALAYLFEKWGLVEGHYKKQGTHEALSDIRESLAEYRWLRAAVLDKTNGALDIAKAVDMVTETVEARAEALSNLHGTDPNHPGDWDQATTQAWGEMGDAKLRPIAYPELSLVTP